MGFVFKYVSGNGVRCVESSESGTPRLFVKWRVGTTTTVTTTSVTFTTQTTTTTSSATLTSTTATTTTTHTLTATTITTTSTTNTNTTTTSATTSTTSTTAALNATQLEALNISVADFRTTNTSASDLLARGFTPTALLDGGYTLSNLADAGVLQSELDGLAANDGGSDRRRARGSAGGAVAGTLIVLILIGGGAFVRQTHLKEARLLVRHACGGNGGIAGGVGAPAHAKSPSLAAVQTTLTLNATRNRNKLKPSPAALPGSSNARTNGNRHHSSASGGIINHAHEHGDQACFSSCLEFQGGGVLVSTRVHVQSACLPFGWNIHITPSERGQLTLPPSVAHTTPRPCVPSLHHRPPHRKGMCGWTAGVVRLRALRPSVANSMIVRASFIACQYPWITTGTCLRVHTHRAVQTHVVGVVIVQEKEKVHEGVVKPAPMQTRARAKRCNSGGQHIKMRPITTRHPLKAVSSFTVLHKHMPCQMKGSNSVMMV